MKAEELIAFENDVAMLWQAGKIKAPVHLQGGNEDQLIDIFKDIKESDWVFASHRSHYHALLKGIPREDVMAAIVKGDSIKLDFPEYRFKTSGIVAGQVPQAVGVALAGETVWCFVGDMAAQTGMFSESLRFSQRMDLPIIFVIEDNGKSVCTPTQECWPSLSVSGSKVIRYYYDNTWPHQGTGVRVEF